MGMTLQLRDGLKSKSETIDEGLME